MFDEEEEEPVPAWGKTIVPHDQYFHMCVEEEERCGACAYCALVKLHSYGARLPCRGPGCKGDASFGARGGLCTECGQQACRAESPCSTCVGFACRDAPGGLCTECGKTKCATVGGCPHGRMAPRHAGQSLCYPCATGAPTPQDCKRRLESEAASNDPRAIKRAKLLRGHLR